MGVSEKRKERECIRDANLISRATSFQIISKFRTRIFLKADQPVEYRLAQRHFSVVIAKVNDNHKETKQQCYLCEFIYICYHVFNKEN